MSKFKNNKLNKLMTFSIVTAMLICTLFTTQVGAIEIAISNQLTVDIEEEYYRAFNGISDIEITEEIKDAVQVSLKDELGNELFDSVEFAFTTRIISTGDNLTHSSYSLSSVDDNTIYATTAVANIKTDSASNSNSNVSATIYITIYWEDIAFFTPKLLYVVPAWSFYDSATTMGANKITYGYSPTSAIGDNTIATNVSNGGTYDVNVSSFGGMRASFFADVTKGSTTYDMLIRVSTW